MAWSLKRGEAALLAAEEGKLRRISVLRRKLAGSPSDAHPPVPGEGGRGRALFAEDVHNVG